MPLPPGTQRKDPNTGQPIVWDGQGWQPAPQSGDQPQGSALSRFVSGFADTNPLTGLYRLLTTNPATTVASAVGTPVASGTSALEHFKNAITNPGNEGALGRLSEFVQGVRDTGGAVPLIGKTAVDAGTKIGNGDIAGGAGDLAGLASSAAVPSIVRNSGRATSAIGRGMETAGNATTRLAPLGAAEAVLNGDWKGAAAAATPYALKYGGKGLQSLGGAIDALVNPEPAQGPLPTVTDNGNVNTPPAPKQLGPARVSTEAPTAPAAGWDVNPAFQKFASDNSTTGNGITNYMGSLLDNGMMDRAAQMGDQTIRSMQRAGYDVPDAGFRTHADIANMVASRPSVEGITQVDETPVAQSEPNDVAVNQMLGDLGTRLDQIPSGAGIRTVSTPPSAPEAPTMPSSWEKFSSASDNGTRSAAPEVPMPDSISAIDKMFGPGSTDLQGQPFQSTAGRGGNNLLYDPQTPTSYLREQFLNPDTPAADQDFLGRALRQRLRLGTSLQNTSVLQ